MARFAALQIRVAAFVDLAHPAGPAGGEDFIRAESSAGGEGQSESAYFLRSAVQLRITVSAGRVG